jgi:hypothetical protein
MICALLSITLSIFSSCSKNNNALTTSNAPPSLTLTASLSGGDETPPNASTAMGLATFSFNTVTNILTGVITFSGIATPTTVAHIDLGYVGVAGSPVFTLEASGPFTSPITYTSPALLTNQVADLEAGNYYVNIHSVAFPNGEIRGQLFPIGGNSY